MRAVHDCAARAHERSGLEVVAPTDEDRGIERWAPGRERYFFEFASFRVEAEPKPVHPGAMQIELPPGGGERCEVIGSPRDSVVVAPADEQRVDGVLEHRVQHGIRH